MEKALAAHVQRHLRMETRLLPGDHDLRRHDTVVERPERTREALFDQFAQGGGEREMASGEFETHGSVLGYGLTTHGFSKNLRILSHEP